MNDTRIKGFLTRLVPTCFGSGPISITGLSGLFAVLQRPRRFGRIVEKLDGDKLIKDLHEPRQDSEVRPRSATGVRIRCLLSLILLMILDILPVPVFGCIGLYIVVQRPQWFRELVEKIYGGTG